MIHGIPLKYSSIQSFTVTGKFSLSFRIRKRWNWIVMLRLNHIFGRINQIEAVSKHMFSGAKYRYAVNVKISPKSSYTNCSHKLPHCNRLRTWNMPYVSAITARQVFLPNGGLDISKPFSLSQPSCRLSLVWFLIQGNLLNRSANYGRLSNLF